ncbi:hypothetical protein [Streptomyces sp. NPDC090798]
MVLIHPTAPQNHPDLAPFPYEFTFETTHAFGKGTADAYDRLVG